MKHVNDIMASQGIRTASFLVVLSLLLSPVSCSKTDRLYGDSMEEISMSPVSSVMSKLISGPVTGAGYPEGETFGVFAWYSEKDAGEEWEDDEELTLYINDAEFAHDALADAWAGKDKSYYWPLMGSLVFAGYSPYSYVQGNEVEDVSFDPDTKTLSIEGYTTGVYVPMSLDDIEDPDVDYENTSQSDLMYFLPKFAVSGNYVGTKNSMPLNINFYHALSLVRFMVSTNPGDEAYVTLKEITLRNVIRKGDFSVRAEGVLRGNTSWTLYKNDDEYIEDVIVFTDADSGKGLTLSTTPRTIAEIMVIPEKTHDIDVTYYLHVNDKVFTETVTIAPTDTDTDPSPDVVNYLDEWKIGKIYTYNLRLGVDMISVQSMADEWTDL